VARVLISASFCFVRFSFYFPFVSERRALGVRQRRAGVTVVVLCGGLGWGWGCVCATPRRAWQVCFKY
jgi:hypothetical protein